MTGTTTLRRTLGFWDLVLFGLIIVAPIAPFTLFGFVAERSAGAVVPSYILGAIGLSLTGWSYAQMAAVAPQAGSVFGFAKLALGSIAGFIGGWAIILDYILLAALCVVYGALYVSGTFPAIGIELTMAAFLVLTLVINALGIQLSRLVEMAIAALQIGIVALFVLAAASLFGDPALRPAPADFWPPATLPGLVATGAAPAIIAFLGFDAIATLAEEVTHAQVGSIIGRAIVATLALLLAIFIVVSVLLLALAHGLTPADPSTAALEIIGTRLPWLSRPLALVVAVALGIGCVIGLHAAVSRLVFAMARDGHLPAALAYVHPRGQAPLAAVLLCGGVIAGLAYVALPHVELLANLVSFGALTGFIMVNVAVVAQFGIKGRSRRVLSHWVAPILGIAVLLWVMSGLLPLALEVGAGWLALGLAWYAGRQLLARGEQRKPVG